jgi:prepilin-type N-terminal cleavage/methylation domain-containing protein
MSSRLRRRRRLTRPRRGFTVIEMIIAIIVMAIGVKVADSLSARRCSSIVGGTQTKRGVTITWTVADSTKTKWVTESVQYKTKSGAKTVNYLTVIQCPD